MVGGKCLSSVYGFTFWFSVFVSPCTCFGLLMYRMEPALIFLLVVQLSMLNNFGMVDSADVPQSNTVQLTWLRNGLAVLSFPGVPVVVN